MVAIASPKRAQILPVGQGDRAMRTRVRRTIFVDGQKTSVSLEDEFWNGLLEIALDRGKTRKQLIAEINADRKLVNMSSAIRLFVLRYYQKLDYSLVDARTFEFDQVRHAVKLQSEGFASISFARRP
jgi:predicted DNA-binding ribbon-helix-helix protein